ncbi:MAG: UvrD-helicase domain-containing protein, partial [Thermus sp.]|nr:UvrD-helicase domain-containing protein [Thermus sp.]
MGGNQPGTRSKAGGLVVQAGAGTGKTQFLVERYLDLLKEVSPLEIVAVTFTEKAALELRGRIRQGIQKAQVGWAPEHRERLLAQLAAAPIGTLHSLAARICREFPLEAGVPPDFQVLDEVEALLWLRDWLEEALLEALEGGTFDPLLEVLGYEGLRATLRHVVEDPLEASRLLEMGPLRMWENLRARIWDIVY